MDGGRGGAPVAGARPHGHPHVGRILAERLKNPGRSWAPFLKTRRRWPSCSSATACERPRAELDRSSPGAALHRIVMGGTCPGTSGPASQPARPATHPGRFESLPDPMPAVLAALCTDGKGWPTPRPAWIAPWPTPLPGAHEAGCPGRLDARAGRAHGAHRDGEARVRRCWRGAAPPPDWTSPPGFQQGLRILLRTVKAQADKVPEHFERAELLNCEGRDPPVTGWRT